MVSTRRRAPMVEPVRRLLVDARPLSNPAYRDRGVGRYVAGLARALHATGDDLRLLVSCHEEREVLGDLPEEVFAPLSRSTIRAESGPGTWFVATGLLHDPIDHDPVPRAVTECSMAAAAIVYDVIPYRQPERYLTTELAARQARLRASLARTLDASLAISQFSADTAVEHLGLDPRRTAVVGAGVDDRFVPVVAGAPRRHVAVLGTDTRPYVVAVTGADDRKNTRGLLAGWGRMPAAVRQAHRLVVVGRYDPPTRARWLAWAHDAGCPDVTFTGAVGDDDMVALLQGARLSIVPSFDEGFGLPVVEAGACGCPVITSNTSSLPEVLDEPAACFDPHDPRAIAAALTAALTDDRHRLDLARVAVAAAQRWRWERVAERVRQALSSIEPRRPRRTRTIRPRVAVVGPFAGSPSGIGTYDERLAAAWRSCTDLPELWCGVDAFGIDQHVVARDGRVSAGAFGRAVKVHDVDHIVTVLGNSPYHATTARLAASAATHVWLHEASLVPSELAIGHMSGSMAWFESRMRDLVADSDGVDTFDRIRAEGGDAWIDPAAYARHGVRLIEPRLHLARSVITSSTAAAETVVEAAPWAPPVLVLPLGSEPADGAPPEPGAPIVVAAGFVAPNKAPDLAVAAFAAIAGRVPAKLVFAGDVLPEMSPVLADAIAEHGMGDRIEVTGRLDDHAYHQRLCGARVGLVLRRNHLGEMSAVITELHSRGVPVVTNLPSAGPPSPGLIVLDPDCSAAEVGDALLPLLTDDVLWTEASAAARSQASRWGFGDVAAALWHWLDSGHHTNARITTVEAG
jgi:glycosyltransferase involved in cell wall biosynthesis